jgi:hypothetical protein
MRSKLGHDFSQVRIHTDRQAAHSAAALQARAFTIGTDIAFAEGQYAPDSADGQRLLTHELTHVMQGGAETGPSEAETRQLTMSQPDDPAEREAETVSQQASSSRGTMTHPSVTPTATVHRAFWNDTNLKDDFWGTKELLGEKWGGVADSAMSSFWDIAGATPFGAAAGEVIDIGKTGIAEGASLTNHLLGNDEQAAKDSDAASRFTHDMEIGALGEIPVFGQGLAAVTGLWDGASAIDRATGGVPAPLSGDIWDEQPVHLDNIIESIL